jgi:hypothetical protein
MSSTYKNVCHAPTQKYACQKNMSITYKYHPLKNMSITYNDEKLFSLASTQFHVNCRSSRYFEQLQNPLIIHQIDISSCEILISKKGSQNFASSKMNFKNLQF